MTLFFAKTDSIFQANNPFAGMAQPQAAPNQNRNQPVNLLDWSSATLFFLAAKVTWRYIPISFNFASLPVFFSLTYQMWISCSTFIYIIPKNLILSNAPDCSERGWNVWVCKNGQLGSDLVDYWLVPKYAETDSDWLLFPRIGCYFTGQDGP